MRTIAEAKASVKIEEVVGGRLPLRRQGSRLIGRCPFHEDGGRPNLTVFPDTQTFNCFACGAHGDAIDFVARLEGMSLTEAAKRLTGVSGPGHTPTMAVRPRRRHVKAPPDRMNEVYGRLLNYLDIAPAHRDSLLHRGFTLQAIERRRYRTLTGRDRHAIPLLIQTDLGPDALKGVPGFFLSGGRWELAGHPGVLIPVRSHEGFIQGLQVRLDRPGGSGKYQWISSSGKPGGASSGAPSHVAQGQGSRKTVWITEGPLKADLVAERLGHTTLGVTGVSTWRRALSEVKALDPKGVVLAFDRDETEAAREAVSRNVSALAEALSGLGVEVRYAAWRSGKGVDDALKAGRTVCIRKEALT